MGVQESMDNGHDALDVHVAPAHPAADAAGQQHDHHLHRRHAQRRAWGEGT